MLKIDLGKPYTSFSLKTNDMKSMAYGNTVINKAINLDFITQLPYGPHIHTAP